MKKLILSNTAKTIAKIVIAYFAVDGVLVILLQEVGLLQKYLSFSDRYAAAVLNCLMGINLVVFLRIFIDSYAKMSGRKLKAAVFMWYVFAIVNIVSIIMILIYTRPTYR